MEPTPHIRIAALDVDYREGGVVAACVGFDEWSEGVAKLELIHRSNGPSAEYVPGRFFERELPHLLAVLKRLEKLPEIVLVDGHVWLAGDDLGLGAHLYDALDGRAVVIGVAKNPFRGATRAIPVLRGESAQALLVTAVGIDASEAADHVRHMHGAHRIPTLLKRVDRLCRDA